MLVPSKFTRLKDSTIFKMRCIVADKKENESVLDLYYRTKDSFVDVSEFMYALDILYVLGVLDFKDDSEFIDYA